QTCALPIFFDHPSDRCFRKTASQGGYRRQGVDYIAHGAKPHNEQSVNGRQVCFRKDGRMHAQERRAPNRERIISLTEWSLGSPTISTRPPHSKTTSRSGTVAEV